MGRGLLSKAFAVFGVVLSLSGSSLAHEDFQHDPAPLKFEHPGDLFHSLSGLCCVFGVLTSENSTGEFRNINGSMHPFLK
jgi:hypothetical protein